MERVKVYNDNGMPVKQGISLFARAFMEHFPLRNLILKEKNN
jgi:hypothetical protein